MAFSGAMVRKAADQTGANFTGAPVITWDTEVYDEGGWFDTGVSNTVFTVPPGVGKVRCGATIRTANGGLSDWHLASLRKNGSGLYNGKASFVSEAGGTGSGSRHFTSGPIPCSSGDTFDVFLQVQSDTSLDFTAAQSHFWIEKVADSKSPGFRATGALGVTTATTVDVPYPTVAANDILILVVNWSGNGVTLTAPGDSFAQIGNTLTAYGVGIGNDQYHSAVFWKRASGSESGNLTLTRSGTGTGVAPFAGTMSSWHSCIASGNPFDGSTDVADASSPHTMSALTTSGAYRRVICVFCFSGAAARNSGPETGWTNRVLQSTSVGSDAVIAIDEIEQVVAGSPAVDFFGSSTAHEAGIHAFALKPP